MISDSQLQLLTFKLATELYAVDVARARNERFVVLDVGKSFVPSELDFTQISAGTSTPESESSAAANAAAPPERHFTDTHAQACHLATL
jgi:hypothetical protein